MCLLCTLDLLSYFLYPTESLAVHLVAWPVALAMADSTNNSSATLWTQNGILADDQEGGRCIMSPNTVIITNMSGETLCNVSINSNCTVRGLKEVIEHTIDVPFSIKPRILPHPLSPLHPHRIA